MNKQTLRFVVLAGLFIIPFVPFLVSSSLFFPFITTKAFAFRIIVEVVFVAWVLLALADSEYRPKKSVILYAVLAFLGVMGLATIFSVDPLRSFWSNFERMEGYVALLHLGAFFLVIGSVFDTAQWKRWWNTSLVASGLMVLYCLFQLGGAIEINQGGVRVDGTFGNATYLAVYMLVHIFIAGLFMWREWGNKGLRNVYAVLMLGQIFILYHTATRGAILGLLGGLLIVALLNIRNREEKRVQKLSSGVLIGLLVLVGGFFALRNTSLVTGSPVLSRFASITTDELTSGGRSFVWPMAVEGVKERPILGWGQDNFIYVFQEHYSPDMVHLEPWFDRAHNIFLDWMVAGGILGLLAYLSLYVALVYLIWRRDAEMEHVEKSILTGLIAAYFFHNLFVFDHLLSYILFFSLLAYIHSRNSGTVLWAKSVSQGTANKFVLPLLVLALGASLYFVNFRPMGTNLSILDGLKNMRTQGAEEKAIESYKRAVTGSYLGREEALTQLTNNSPTILRNANVTADARNEFYLFAKGTVIAEAERDADYAKSQITAGSFLSSVGSAEEALMYLNRAKELIPGKQQVYFELGSAYINADMFEEALAVFKEAHELNPEYSEAKVIYLIGAIYAGDHVLEASLLAELPERDVAFDGRVLSAYYANQRFDDAIEILEKRKTLDPEKSEEYEKLIEQIESERS